MSRRRLKLWAGIGAVVLVLVVVFLFPVPRYALVGWLRGENFYGGKPTSYWRDSIIASRQPIPPGLYRDYLIWTGYRSDDAYMPLFRGDPASLPVLHDLLRDEDASFRRLACNGLSNIQRRAMEEGTTVPQLAVTMPTLLEYLARTDSSRDSASDRLHAAVTLGEFGPMAQAAIPQLRENLKGPNPVVQVFIAKSLCKIDPHQAEARQRLIAGLTDPNQIVRVNAVEGLEELLKYHPVEGARLLRQEPTLPTALRSAAEMEMKRTSPDNKVKESVERLLREVAP